MKNLVKSLLVIIPFCLSATIFSQEGWDYSVTYNEGTEDEYHAVLWIGNPDKPVRGVLLTSMIRNEPDFNFDPDIRQACADMGLAEVFFYIDYVAGTYDRGPISTFNPDNGDIEKLQTALKDLAGLSGKPEIEHAPWLVFGHSTAGAFVRNIAWWKPGRVFGVIFYKTGGYNPPDWVVHPDTATFANIPWLSVAARNDKYGDWNIMVKEMMPWRMQGCLMSQIVEPTMEEGHSLWRPFNGPYMAKWIRKAAESKIPYDTVATDGTIDLLHVENSTGVLSDTLLQVLMDSARIRDNLLRFYEDVDEDERGNRFWHFDADMALTWTNYHHVAHDPYVPEKDTTVSGQLVFWKDQIPLGTDVPLRYPLSEIFIYQAPDLYGSIDAGDTSTVDEEGNFELITYDRNINIDMSILGELQFFNGADALLMERIIDGDISFTPGIFQVWAADVNLDDRIDSGDLDQLIDRIIMAKDYFDQSENYDHGMDWVFWDSDNIKFNKNVKISENYPDDDGVGYSKHRIPEISCQVMIPYDEPGNPFPIQYNDPAYYGILLGDIDGSFSLPDELVPVDSIIIDIDLIGELGTDSFCIPLFVRSSSPVTSADIEILLESEGNLYDDVITGQEINVYTGLRDNTLRLVSYTRDEISEEQPFAWIKYSGTPFNKEYLVLQDGFINGSRATLVFRETIESVPVNRGKVEFQIFPVPAGDQLNIRLSGHQSEQLAIRLMDLSGRIVLERVGNVASGRTEFLIDIAGLSPGTYITDIQVGEEHLVQKFVK